MPGSLIGTVHCAVCTGMFAASGDLIKLHSELCRPLTMGADIRIVLHLDHVADSLTVTGTEKFANYTCVAWCWGFGSAVILAGSRRAKMTH